MNLQKFLLFLMFISLIPANSVYGQDPIEIPSWELGWETDMDGTYTLSVNDDDDIVDEIQIFIDNQRMGELNIELEIEWSSSDDIPIELDYPDSVAISGSTNETISISLLNENGYVFDRSPNSTMVISVLANELFLDQSTSSQEIEGDLVVPSVYELIPSAKSRDEILYPGSSVEYDFNIENRGNSDDAVDEPRYNIRSCPHLSIEGIEELDGQVISVSQIHDVVLVISASEAHPDSTCEITISITSSGDNQISSIVFEISVNAVDRGVEDSSDDGVVDDLDLDDSGSDLTESGTLSYLSFIELSFILCFVLIFISKRK